MITPDELANMSDDELIDAQRNYIDLLTSGTMAGEDIDACNAIMDEEDRRKVQAW